MSNKYEQYYSSADCSVFAERADGGCPPVMLDKVRTIAFSEALTAQPIYGLGNSKYGFISQGNLIVNGVLEFNFSHPNYLSQTLAYLEANGDLTQAINTDADITLAQFQQADDSQIVTTKSSLRKQALATNKQYANGILLYPQNFNLKIVLNNGFLYQKDNDKIFFLRGVKIIGSQLPITSTSDDPLVIAYTFVAREVSRATIPENLTLETI